MIPPPSGTITRYTVSSTDVIADMRINVCLEGSDKVLWYKERFLSDMEIVEHIVHNPTSSIQWTIHKPQRGWYIRIRAPTFPPDVFIQLLPVSSSSPHYIEGALSFSSRTNVPSPESTSSSYTPRISGSGEPGAHSYPPTPPPIIVVLPPSATTPEHKDDGSTPKRRLNKPPPTQITPFVLSPHSFQPTHVPSSSLLSRALSALKNSRPSHSNSFTLTRLSNSEPGCAPPPPYTSQAALVPAAASSSVSLNASNQTLSSGVLGGGPGVLAAPLLTFHDRTPLLTVRSLSGVIEINEAEQLVLGVDTSFWVAVALTYLEFLEDRESYLAAMYD